MDNLIKIFGRNFIYGGLILGLFLTLIDLIKNSSSNIALYAFLSGSFFITTLTQYYYVNKVSKKNVEPFLYNSILGGIFWVIYAIILYYLNKFIQDTRLNILISSILMIIISIIYYFLLKN
tara:strand:- start:11 stop:373 length:363 start_codon:yes stop_codon:yes gene_type:complete